jgi:hypothetical protein
MTAVRRKQLRQLGDVSRDPSRLIVSTYASRLNTKGKKPIAA